MTTTTDTTDTTDRVLGLVAAHLCSNGDDDAATRRTRLDTLLEISDGSDVDESLAQLAAAEVVARSMKARQTVAVLDARALGASWQRIGEALGLTEQAARQRFGSLA